MRFILALVVVVVTVGQAWAQAPDPRRRDGGYIGRALPDLEIDDCPRVDPSLSPDALRGLASEHYQRGETLYVQGDYDGAVVELVAAYCLIPVYTILKDIGQAYERSLDYEKAIGYLERYIAAVPADAQRANACAADPQVDKANVSQRVKVLSNLQAKVFVETVPPDARITISNDSGIAARARSRQEISIHGGTYDMLVEHDDFEPSSQKIDVRIGKPYTYSVRLEARRGTLAVQATPPDARVFLDDRAVGIGRWEDTLPTGRYRLSVEAPGRVSFQREVEVLAGAVNTQRVELEPVPQAGRRQLIVAAGVGGAFAAGGLSGVLDDTRISSTASLIGAAAGALGGYFLIPTDVPLGTSNLTITSSVAGSIAGVAVATLFTDRDEVVQPAAGAALLLGGAAGYYVADRYRVSTGDAALFATSVFWGSVSGALFTTSFDPPRAVGGGLLLSGIGMGTVGGILMTRYFDISRRHALLIDVGGLIGGVSGFALQGLLYETASSSRAANFTLGGIGIGLVTAGILTRSYDVPKLPVRPTLGAATGPDGRATTTYGIVGTW